MQSYGAANMGTWSKNSEDLEKKTTRSRVSSAGTRTEALTAVAGGHSPDPRSPASGRRRPASARREEAGGGGRARGGGGAADEAARRPAGGGGGGPAGRFGRWPARARAAARWVAAAARGAWRRAAASVGGGGAMRVWRARGGLRRAGRAAKWARWLALSVGDTWRGGGVRHVRPARFCPAA